MPNMMSDLIWLQTAKVINRQQRLQLVGIELKCKNKLEYAAYPAMRRAAQPSALT